VDFLKIAPKPFVGTTNPVETEHWINEMEKAFQGSKCSEKEKVDYAVYLLHDSAQHWWKSVERSHEKNKEPFSWAEFREEFYAKYFPSSRRREMQKQFIRLRQRNRTIDDYKAEFD